MRSSALVGVLSPFQGAVPAGSTRGASGKRGLPLPGAAMPSRWARYVKRATAPMWDMPSPPTRSANGKTSLPGTVFLPRTRCFALARRATGPSHARAWTTPMRLLRLACICS